MIKKHFLIIIFNFKNEYKRILEKLLVKMENNCIEYAWKSIEIIKHAKKRGSMSIIYIINIKCTLLLDKKIVQFVFKKVE